MNLWQAIKLLKRRWWWIALITGIVTGTVFAYYWAKPNEWEGQAVIAEYRALQSNRTIIYPDPYTLQVDLITRLQNMSNVVRSYTVLLSTWRELRDSGNWAPAALIKRNYPPSEQDLRGALDLLARLDIKPIPNTEYLSVTITVQGDEEARRQAEYATTILLDKFQEHYNNLNAQVARPSREFVQRQYEDAQREYERATRQLSEYLNQNKDVIQSENQTNLFLQQIARFEAQLYDAITAQQSASARLARLTQQLEQEARRPGGGEYRSLSKVLRLNPLLQQLQSQLAQNENELQGLIARGLGPQHPDVKRIQGRIEELNKQIREQQTMILDAETTGVNDLYQALKRDYLAALVERNVADQRVRELQSQVAELRGRLQDLPERQRIAQELTLKAEFARNRLALMKTKLDEAITRENELQTAGFVKVIDGPVSVPVDKRIPFRVALALALSLLLSIGLVLLVGQVDQGIYTPSQAEALFGIPTIAALPRMRRTLLARDRAEQTPLSAAYQLLSTSIAQANWRLNGNALAITGAEADVGRTTVAYNLALTLARDGARVVLIDADMRNPNLHQLVRADVNHPGLSDILLGKVGLEQAVQQTAVEGVVFIGAGTPVDNPGRLLRSPQMQELIQKLKGIADFVILDTPSSATFADSLVVGTASGNVLIVHTAGQGMTEATREMLARFKQHGINMVGVVLNKVRLDDSVVFQQFQRGYYRALEGRNGTAVRAAIPPSSRVDTDSEPEQAAPRD
ncbi:MAG: hypothetical protein C4336_01070 [Armatimonadota bacterium]